jgi:hypothetical protein
VPTHPEHTRQQIEDIIHNIKAATRVALGHVKSAEADVRRAAAVDATKYDLKVASF